MPPRLASLGGTFEDRGRPSWAAPSSRVSLRRAAWLFALLAACSSGSREDPLTGAVDGVVGRARATSIAAYTRPPRASPPGTTDRRSPASSAREALDAYLDGLARQEFTRALDWSERAARRIALVRTILAEHNRVRGAATAVRITGVQFVVSSAQPRRVAFRGRALLHSTVSGGRSSPQESKREIGDPVVERRGAGWVVTSFRWDRRPVVAFDGKASMTRGNVEFRLEGSIAFGDVVGVVVALVAEGEHRVAVDGDRLRIGKEEAASIFGTLIEGQPGLLYLTYPRRDARPDLWRARVSIDGATSGVALSFS